MNKGLQIFLLVCVFLISAAVGFVLEQILLEGEAAHQEVVIVEPEVVIPQDTVSTIPVILIDAVKVPVREANGNFSFSAQAEVESGQQLKYALYKDEACMELVTENLSGNFYDVPPVSSAVYYLRAQNLVTGDWSDILPVNGFVQLVMYVKITKAELENLINVQKDYTMAPKDFKKRTSPTFTVVVNGANENERGVSDIADICMKTLNGIWSSVVVEDLDYDRQNRLQKLTIRVNY